MTHREARQKLGTRRGRREGTKTCCIPGASNGGGKGHKQGPTPRYRNHHAGQRTKPAILVRKILREANGALGLGG